MKRIGNIRKVLTPIDFSENSEVIARSAAYMAGAFEAELVLVYVVQDFEDYSGFFVPQMNIPDFKQELLAGAEERMERFCKESDAEFKSLGISSLGSTVLVGDTAERITVYADDNEVDLIIMGTHGYKGLEKIMFGSIADKVVKTAPCPTMTVNPYTCCSPEE
ncbi:MAG: universal stress protein [Thermodesulfobacteriota bacterium]